MSNHMPTIFGESVTLTFGPLNFELRLDGNGYAFFINDEQVHTEQSTIAHVWGILKANAA